MPLLRNVGLLATCPAGTGQGEIGAIRGGALAWEDGRVRWVGPETELPERYRGEESLDAGGALVVPGLVDAHTHLVFAGWRAGEFVRRIRGASYLEVARSGGGIAATVRATRAASEEELAGRAREFLAEMAALGVTTVEGKSGYGLEPEAERKQLRVYRRLAEEGPLRIVATFLGAHTVPPEWSGDRAGYVDLVVERMLPAVAAEGLARFCDAFVEEGAFEPGEARRVLAAARELGLGLKLHADQLSDGGGALLAAELGAASADHLERVSEEGIAALARAGTVAVVLPFAALCLGSPPAPARRLIAAGVPVAVATDFNPGTAPSYHLPLALSLACVRGGMTPAEALKGGTAVAARSLGLADEAGSLEPGKRADFAVIDAPDVDTWLYHVRPNACRLTVVGGEVVWRAGRAA